MSRTRKGQKGPGWDFWARRAFGKFNGWSHSTDTKKLTNKLERRTRKALLDPAKDPDTLTEIINNKRI